MSERQYANYSQGELFELKRDIGKLRRQAERQRDAYTRQFQGSGSDWVWTSEDYLMFSQRIKNHDDTLYEIQKELAFRRERRKERQDAQDRQQNTRQEHRGAKPRSADPAKIALASWLKRTNHSESPAIKTVRRDITWELNGRFYYGMFSPVDNTIRVWIMVRPGTPGATFIDGTEYMPANDMSQIGQALSAEA